MVAIAPAEFARLAMVLRLANLVRTTGVRFVQAAQRHLRVLREFVVETARLQDRRRREEDWWMRATALQRG